MNRLERSPHLNDNRPLERSPRHGETEFSMDSDQIDFREMRQSIILDLRRLLQSHGGIEQTHQRNSLLRLPPEILLQIFQLLQRKHLFVLLTVCKEIADLIVEILWFRPNMQNDALYLKIKQIMERPRESTFWNYRLFIKRLNLSFMTKMVDDDLLSLFVGCPKLERLTLVNCTKLTRGPISRVLANCERLQLIDLTGVTDVHDDIMNALATHCTRLQGLYAPTCGNVLEAAIINLLRSCPMLKRVKFNNSDNITDASIKQMHESCRLLVEIDLHYCPNVTDKYLKQIFLDFAQLREFRISNAAGVTDLLFELLPNEPYLEKLRIIDITGGNAITDKLVEKLVVCAPKLRNVVFLKCMQITDASLRALSQLGRSLHYIHMGHCGLITDFGVASLVRLCHRIQYIDLACCTQLTDWTLVELASLPKLRRIGMVKCSLITDSGILELVRRRGEQDCLERVHLSYCTNLTVGPIYMLLKSCPRLTHLSLTGITSFLRREITRFCREPPPDFNENQRNLFCVFSGHGVNQLRAHLTQMMDERTYQIDHGDIQALLERRRRIANAANDPNQDRAQPRGRPDVDDGQNFRAEQVPIGVWPGPGLGLMQQQNMPNQQVEFVNREIFRELGEGNMNPVDMREYIQRLIRQRYNERLANMDEYERTDDAQQQAQFAPVANPQNAPQLRQPAVFPNGMQGIPIIDDEYDEDVEMIDGPLFPRRE